MYDQNKWRKERYWFMETDNILKAHTKLLMYAFNKYAAANI